MAQPIRYHGRSTRGLGLSRGSVLFSGPFGRIFRALPPADFGTTDRESQQALVRLGSALSADPDPVKDGPDAEESGIPAAYTYLGQFIDHDLTFDPASSLQRQNDPEALVNFRTPRFDLDSVYGRGPEDQPYLYDGRERFLLGRKLSGSALDQKLDANDLPRSAAKPARAIIGDPRNDENVIISQFQGLFLQFHNNLADRNPGLSFAEVQREVRFHYQWMVVHDFLPTIISHRVLDDVLPHRAKNSNPRKDPPKLTYYHYRNEVFMPLEFSVAAYRFGHSMVRPGYRLNDNAGPFPIFAPRNRRSLAGLDTFLRQWAIDWARFIDIEPRPFGDERNAGDPENAKRMQLAYLIDTSLVNPLGRLPRPVVQDPQQNLANRNLLRGWRMRLPSGQAIARSMGVTPLDDEAIKIGKFTGDPKDIKGDILTEGGKEFKGNCPLWVYVLAETEEVDTTVRILGGVKQRKTRRLGEVGGRIVAETFAGILEGDSKSHFNQNPLWEPSLAVNGVFGLREFVKFALGK